MRSKASQLWPTTSRTYSLCTLGFLPDFAEFDLVWSCVHVSCLLRYETPPLVSLILMKAPPKVHLILFSIHVQGPQPLVVYGIFKNKILAKKREEIRMQHAWKVI